MPSPFDKKKPAAAAPTSGPASSGVATAPPPPAALPDAAAFSDDADDPYNAADPSAMSGYKPISFMNQLVLIHPIDTGRMKTKNSGKEEDGKSPYAKIDLIPLTTPEAGTTPTKDKMVARGDAFVVLNKDGDEEEFEPYEIGERLEELVVFNKPLVASVASAKRKGNNWILGRITRGEAKEGQSVPIILVAASAEDKAYYQQWRQSQR